MLNRGFRILWVKVQIYKMNCQANSLVMNNSKSFYLNLPISFYAFEELLDCFMDLLDFVCFFEPPNHKPAHSLVSAHTIRDLSNSIIQLLASLTWTEPYDLVDVEVDNVKVSIRIR